jgi:hypothetical protein
MSVPPTKQHLEALAGWSLLARQNASDHQSMALCRFGEASGELAGVVDELVPSISGSPTQHSTASPRQPLTEPQHAPWVPEEVRELVMPHLNEGGECPHKFSIDTQKCVYCGLTFRAVKGRKPELM